MLIMFVRCDSIEIKVQILFWKCRWHWFGFNRFFFVLFFPSFGTIAALWLRSRVSTRVSSDKYDGWEVENVVMIHSCVYLIEQKSTYSL